MPMLIMQDRRWHATLFMYCKNPANQKGMKCSKLHVGTNTSLLLQIRSCPVLDNVIECNNVIECLDLHLSEITLNSYRGSIPEIVFARFFVVRARVLKVMRFAIQLSRKTEWFAD